MRLNKDNDFTTITISKGVKEELIELAINLEKRDYEFSSISNLLGSVIHFVNKKMGFNKKEKDDEKGD